MIMLPEQRSAFAAMCAKLRAGRISRRTFLARAATIGFSTTAAASLLESCSGLGGMPAKATIYLVWQSEFDITKAYHDLVDTFNRTNMDNIHVSIQSVQAGTNDLTTIERNVLKAQSAAIDIFSIDVTTVAEFASQNWIIPISEQQWPLQERANYLTSALNACTFKGQLWAAPYRTDVGLIYYRADLVSTPPTRWEDLTDMTKQVMAQKHPSALRYGYVWQASQYEGLVCNFDEVLRGYGGSILDPHDPTKVTVNSPEGQQALTTMVGWTKSIFTPPDIATYTEEVSRQTWESGQAIFMRNWPYVYADAQKNMRAHSFAIHPMLYGGNNTVGHSSIGGWQLAINAFVPQDRREAAWKFIHYMLGEQAQKYGARTASWLVSLKSIYQDQDVLNTFPLFKQIGPILQTAQPRPVTPRYDDVSQAIRLRVRQALNGLPVAQALQNLATDLKPLVAN
jgi:multiple sugar transport system substrate-binding protein